MRDPYVVLAEKEAAVARLRTIIAALRVAAPLVAEDDDLRQAIESDKQTREAIHARAALEP
jgi:hypothetical protein